MITNVINNIPINYSSNNYQVSFNLKFGLGIDSAIEPDSEARTDINTLYKIEKVEREEQVGYRVLGHEGPLVTNVSDINISNYNTDATHTYALGIAFDIKNPEYESPSAIQPTNIERDGVMWNVPMEKVTHSFDQNAKARFQIVLKRALEEGYVPTEEERFMGMEETSATTGLLYITFMIFHKEKEHNQGVTFRGGGGGVTRGGGGCDQRARVGYGNSASTSSQKSTYKVVPNTEKFILPIRYRIVKESEVSTINCADNLASAINVSNLQKMTMEPPF